jgi:phage portal protein BeeE
MNALTKAFADTERSYMACKASVGAVSRLMANAPTSSPLGLGEGDRFSTAKGQLQAFRSWVFAAIRPIANRIAAQPVKVGRVKGKARLATKAVGNVTELDRHPILDLIANPNDIQTGWGLVWATVASINLTGKAFWWVPDGNEQLYMIPCQWITGFTGTTKFKSWKVQAPGTGETIHIPADRVVYFSLPSPSDPWGAVSPLQAAAEAVNNDDDIQRSQRAAFKRGIFPATAIIVGKQPVENVPGGLRPHLTAAQQRQIIRQSEKITLTS